MFLSPGFGQATPSVRESPEQAMPGLPLAHPEAIGLLGLETDEAGGSYPDP